MDSTLVWIIALAVAAACGYFCYRTAEEKGHSALAFGLLGFFLPLIGIIVVLVISPRRPATPAT